MSFCHQRSPAYFIWSYSHKQSSQVFIVWSILFSPMHLRYLFLVIYLQWRNKLFQKFDLWHSVICTYLSCFVFPCSYLLLNMLLFVFWAHLERQVGKASKFVQVIMKRRKLWCGTVSVFQYSLAQYCLSCREWWGFCALVKAFTCKKLLTSLKSSILLWQNNWKWFQAKKCDIWTGYKNRFFMMRVVKHCRRLPREVLGAPSLETLKARLDGALSNLI